MRAIIIEEERFVEICKLLQAECLHLPKNAYLREHTGLSEEQIKFAADEMFRKFNYHFVRWAQSHGANCTN